MVRDPTPEVEMTQRNMTVVLRQALADLHAGQYAQARDAAAPWRASPAGSLLHALATAAAGAVEPGAHALAAIARANPAANHPALDLADLLDRHDHPTIPHLEAALRHTQAHPALLTRLGAAHATHGSIHAAIAAFRAALHAAPTAQTWSNLAKSLAAAGALPEAHHAFTQAISLAPGDPQLRLNHAVATLRTGDWTAGWPGFRARHALPGRPPPPPGPELTRLGQLPGRTLLLLHDEGFGDTIQFIRYAPLLAARAARVLLWVPTPLVRLLTPLPGLTLVTGGTPGYDLWARLPDLPAVFGTTPGTIPAPHPGLAADPALVHAWATRLPATSHRRIGLAWAGAGRPHDQAAAATDRLRSLAPAHLTPLLARRGVSWVSLQKDRPAPEPLFDPMPQVQDFADTAAIIANLDLVVSVDTAVAHLAASLGKPVLLLDRHDNCWRWLGGRTDSPWYPSLTILRQPAPGDWQTVLQAAAARLS